MATIERERQQDVEHGPREVDPEVADRRAGMTGEPTDECDEHRHAHAGRHEVLERQPDHLGEVAQRRFAAVVLPVRVGHEADRGVEGAARLHARQILRVERQVTLETKNEVEEEEPRQVEAQQCERVPLPAVLDVLVNGGDAVEPAFHRPQGRAQPCSAAFVDGHHVEPERLGEGNDGERIEGQVQDVLDRHGSVLEVFGTKEHVQHVGADGDGDDEGDQVLCVHVRPSR